MWKEEVSLRDLKQKWPPQVLSMVALENMEGSFRNIYERAFIRNRELKNKFAFVMKRQ